MTRNGNSIELSDEALEAICERASAKAVSEFSKSHNCRFNDKEAQRVHAFNRACDEHEVSEGDILVMVYSAKTAHGFFKDLGKKLFYTVAISGVLIVAWLFGADSIHRLLGTPAK